MSDLFLSDITDAEFKVEAKRRGYNLIKKPEPIKLLPCVCGRKRLEQMWCTYNWSYFRCPKCMIYSEKGKNDRQAKLNWNKMIEEKMKDGYTP